MLLYVFKKHLTSYQTVTNRVINRQTKKESNMETILIIDDDVAIGNLEQEVLEWEGYLVQRAYSGRKHCCF